MLGRRKCNRLLLCKVKLKNHHLLVTNCALLNKNESAYSYGDQGLLYVSGLKSVTKATVGRAMAIYAQLSLDSLRAFMVTINVLQWYFNYRFLIKDNSATFWFE